MRILVATDGSEASLRAAAAVRRYFGVTPATQVDILYVFPVPVEYGGYHGVSSILPRDPNDATLRRLTDPIMQKSLAALDIPAEQVRQVVRIGEAAEDIIAHARAIEADVIVMGSRGLRGLKEMYLGSVSNAVLHRSPCPVLIIH